MDEVSGQRVEIVSDTHKNHNGVDLPVSLQQPAGEGGAVPATRKVTRSMALVMMMMMMLVM